MPLPKVQSRTIKTSFDYPPIPTRNADWSAVVDGYDEGDPIGRGPTEMAALADLLRQLVEREEDE